MSWIVPWNGKEYDVDPTEFDGLELSDIKKRTGLSLKGLLSGVSDMDGEAVRALFWTVDRRDNPDLKFSDYRGPSVRVWGPHLYLLEELADEMGKWVPEQKTPDPVATLENDGSDLSADSTDGALQPSTTD